MKKLEFKLRMVISTKAKKIEKKAVMEIEGEKNSMDSAKEKNVTEQHQRMHQNDTSEDIRSSNWN